MSNNVLSVYLLAFVSSVAQLARAWQAICQVTGSSPSLSHISPSFFLVFISHLSFSMTLIRLRSDCQVWSTEPASHTSHSRTPPPPPPPPKKKFFFTHQLSPHLDNFSENEPLIIYIYIYYHRNHIDWQL